MNKISTAIWNIANDLRGNMDANEFKEYILLFVCYKQLSDKVEMIFKEELEQDETYEELDAKNKKRFISDVRISAGIFIEPDCFFSVFAKLAKNKDKDICAKLENAFKKIETSEYNKDDLDFLEGIFTSVNLNSEKLGKLADEKAELISKVINEISDLEFDSNVDTIGSIYEELISLFAGSAGKKGGEFYTPHEVSKLLAKIINEKKLKSIEHVYDPTCGSGSLLLQLAKYQEDEDPIKFYGRELNSGTWNLAKMNILIHGIKPKNAHINQGDTLKKNLKEELRGKEIKFDVILANPPFSAKWNATADFLNDDRFSEYGVLAPKSYAEFAFITHMIYHLKSSGVMAVIIPHGVLFRGGSEAKIRRILIEKKNVLDCIIGLAPNIFYGTGIPTAILIFKACKEKENLSKCRNSDSDNVFFIDASKEFVKVRSKNILSDEINEKIVNTYIKREDIEGFAKKVSLQEIAKNDYNLKISRYIENLEEEEQVDIDEVKVEIEKLKNEGLKLDLEIKEKLKDMDL